MNQKLVSIIIPTYSRPTNLIRAIESVKKQTYSPIEIIVVDDNGLNTPFQKETQQILSDLINNEEIVYIPHEVNKNGSAARNTGVYAAHGEIVGLLDDDDEFCPNKIEEQVKCLDCAHQKDDSVKGCFCNSFVNSINRKYSIINKINGNLAEQLLLGRVRFNSSTMIMYKDAYLSIKGFDECYKRHQDWEFIIRFLERYKFVLACPNNYLNIKNSTPNVLTSNILKSIEYKEFFLTNFQNRISRMKNHASIYHYQYILLVYSLVRGRFYKEAWLYYKKSNTYQYVSFTEYVKILMYFFVGFK